MLRLLPIPKAPERLDRKNGLIDTLFMVLLLPVIAILCVLTVIICDALLIPRSVSSVISSVFVAIVVAIAVWRGRVTPMIDEYRRGKINRLMEYEAARRKSFAAYAGWSTGLTRGAPLGPLFAHVNGNMIREYRDAGIRQDNWRYETCSTEYGNYSVVQIKIDRRLPNIFFDGLHNGRVERALMDAGQRLRLDVNFDDYVHAYSPYRYEIDTLALFSPEVLQVIMRLNFCDIELYRNTIYLYMPVIEPEGIAEFVGYGYALRDALAHNFHTYRDERIEYAEGRRTVSVHASRLNQRKAAPVGSYYLIGVGVVIVMMFIPVLILAIVSSRDIGSILELVGMIALGLFICIWFGIRAVVKAQRESRESRRQAQTPGTRDHTAWK